MSEQVNISWKRYADDNTRSLRIGSGQTTSPDGSVVFDLRGADGVTACTNITREAAIKAVAALTEVFDLDAELDELRAELDSMQADYLKIIESLLDEIEAPAAMREPLSDSPTVTNINYFLVV